MDGKKSDENLPESTSALITSGLDNSGWRYLQGLFSRKLVLWGSFIALLWILRDFFALFLFTFVLSYLGNSVVEHLTGYVPRRKLMVCVVFLTFVAVLTTLCIITFPKVIDEVRHFVKSNRTLLRNVAGNGQEREDGKSPLLEKAQEALERSLGRWSDYINVEPILESLEESTPAVLKTVVAEIAESFAAAGALVLYFLLAILLSFFLVLDLPNIARNIAALEKSRLSDYYREVYPGVIAFFSLLGKALEAQTVIALLNTSMTAVGLALLGVPKVAMLSVIVFFCSYVPVLGMWISTVPLILVAITQSAGLWLGFQVLILVAIIHTLEAYVINPRIYGSHMEVHPLMVLIILILGEHLVGLWGLILAVPIWSYIYRYVILGKVDEFWVTVHSSSRSQKACPNPTK